MTADCDIIIRSNKALRLEAACDFVSAGRAGRLCLRRRYAGRIMLLLVAGVAEGLNGLPDEMSSLSR